MMTTRYLILSMLLCYLMANPVDQVATTEFGKTVLQAMQVTLRQDPASFDKVRSLLVSMKEDILSVQQNDDELIGARQSQCDEQSASALEVINVAEVRKAAAEQVLPLAQQDQSDKQQQMADKVGEEGRNLDRIAGLTAERKETKLAYDTKRDELTQLVGALHEAKQLISQLSTQNAGAVLVQLKNHSEYFKQSMPKQRTFHKMVEMLLVQMHSKLSNEGVEKVVKIIDNLVEAIFNVQKQEMVDDDEREKDYQKQKARFEFANVRLAGSVAQLNADYLNLKQKILEIQNEIANAVGTISDKQQEKKDWELTCSDAANSHNGLTALRNEQLEIIEQCLQVIEGKEDVTYLLQKQL